MFPIAQAEHWASNYATPTAFNTDQTVWPSDLCGQRLYKDPPRPSPRRWLRGKVTSAVLMGTSVVCWRSTLVPSGILLLLSRLSPSERILRLEMKRPLTRGLRSWEVVDLDLHSRGERRPSTSAFGEHMLSFHLSDTWCFSWRLRCLNVGRRQPSYGGDYWQIDLRTCVDGSKFIVRTLSGKGEHGPDSEDANEGSTSPLIFCKTVLQMIPTAKLHSRILCGWITPMHGTCPAEVHTISGVRH